MFSSFINAHCSWHSTSLLKMKLYRFSKHLNCDINIIFIISKESEAKQEIIQIEIHLSKYFQ
jgi:hypothetical protein